MDISIADIMTRNPITAKPDDNLLECSRKMIKKRVGSLIVVENKKVVGFLTMKDILWAIVKKSEKELSKIKAKDISRKKIYTLKSSFSLDEAIKRIKKLKIDRFPVVDKKELVGIVTARDILNFNPSLYPELEEFSKIREEEDKLKRIKLSKDKPVTEGICEECGNYGPLFRVNGELVCESCKNSM